MLATGVVDHEPALPGIPDLRKRGLLRQCPICDGFEFTGRRIGVIGAGAHGAREALFLCNYSDDVTLISLDADRPIDAALDDELRQRNVERLTGEVRAAQHAAGRVVLEMADGSRPVFDVLYAALGNTPRAGLATMVGAKTDALGAVVVDAHCRTQVPGVYAAGDVVHGLDQLVVAVGQAAIAATAVHNDLTAGRFG